MKASTLPALLNGSHESLQGEAKTILKTWTRQQAGLQPFFTKELSLCEPGNIIKI